MAGDPQLREVRVFSPGNRAGAIFGMDDTLPGSDLLPGFAVPVRAIFEDSNAALHIEVIRQLMAV